MKALWATWRMEYIENTKSKSCILCKIEKNKKQDKKNLVLIRGEYAFSILNRYPYNNGHFMVCPIRHVSSLDKLNKNEIFEIFELIKKTKRLITKTIHPHAYNVGLNEGRIAGAGILGHIHIHVVPRWQGDTNFMPVIANTKVIPQSLNNLYSKLIKSK